MNGISTTELQAITKIINGDEDLLKSLDSSLFFDLKDEFDFIYKHHEEYGNIPDDVTFLDRFSDLVLLTKVNETNRLILNNLRHDFVMHGVQDILVRYARMPESDQLEFSQDFAEEIHTLWAENPIQARSFGIYKDAIQRYDEYTAHDIISRTIPTGFAEIDENIVGWHRGNEFVVFYARTNHGKSWLICQTCRAAAEANNRVGLFSPEMLFNDIGYRIDTLGYHMSNWALSHGKEVEGFGAKQYKEIIDGYKQYVDKDVDIFVTRPKDFGNKVTVQKLRDWVKSERLDMLAIDGITRLTDTRSRGDSPTIKLTNLCEDLMDLSAEMEMPVIGVVQANRGGVVAKDSDDMPELESIRDSDGIAHNASQVYAMRQRSSGDNLKMLILECQKSRNGEVGKRYYYTWDIDKGIFVPTESDGRESLKKERKASTGGKRKRSRAEEDVY